MAGSFMHADPRFDMQMRAMLDEVRPPRLSPVKAETTKSKKDIDVSRIQSMLEKDINRKMPIKLKVELRKT